MCCRKSVLAFFLITALLLSGCGSAAAPAQEPAAEQYERIPDEPYEAVPYALYPAPEGGYVGDVMPFVTEDGILEIYYLYDTDHNGQGYHPQSYARYSSNRRCYPQSSREPCQG